MKHWVVGGHRSMDFIYEEKNKVIVEGKDHGEVRRIYMAQYPQRYWLTYPYAATKEQLFYSLVAAVKYVNSFKNENN